MTCTNDPTKDLEQALKNFKGKYYIPNDDDGIDYQQLYERQKHRADELEKQLNSLKEYIPSLRSAVESTLYYSHPDIELNLQSDISSYSSLMEQICKELEEDNNA